MAIEEVVEHHDFVTCLQQFDAGVRADVAGTASDEDRTHQTIFRAAGFAPGSGWAFIDSPPRR